MKIIFAGAGTAGHVEPALAVARWLREHHSDIEIEFLGTMGGLENQLVPVAGFSLRLIEKAPFPRRFGVNLFTWPFKFVRTLGQVSNVLEGANLVMGFGGYVAAPAYLAARRKGLPIIAHEANAKMGLANKLAKLCGAEILRAFDFGSEKGVGIPLKSSIVELAKASPEARAQAKRQALRAMNLDPHAPTILVFGGSLGAERFNEVIAKSQREISRKGFQIIHSVGGRNELPQAQAGYYPLQYIEDMAGAYAASDLVISRSGASSVAETGALGIYSLYVPLPIGNGEQAENAKVVASHGGGAIIDNNKFSDSWLLENISSLMSSALAWRERATESSIQLNAAQEISQKILQVLHYE